MSGVKNQGSLGGPTNRPTIDQGTLVRQQSHPPGVQACEPLFVVTAEGMYQTIMAIMDEYAKEIFNLWFHGKAPDEVVFENEKWANYMKASLELQKQIKEALAVHARLIRDRVKGSTGEVEDDLQHRFHGEVGGEHGGYKTGYQVLHGSNRDVGNCQITGRYRAIRSKSPGGGYDVTYRDLTLVFNDKVDIKKIYSLDVSLGRMASNMAKCLQTGPPKDYILRIKWRLDAPINVKVDAGDEAIPLREFVWKPSGDNKR